MSMRGSRYLSLHCFSDFTLESIINEHGNTFEFDKKEKKTNADNHSIMPILVA